MSLDGSKDGKDGGWWKEIGDGMVQSIAKGRGRKKNVLTHEGYKFSFYRRETIEYYVCDVGGVKFCNVEIKKQNGRYYWYVPGKHDCGSCTQALDVHGRENEISDSGHFKKSVTQTLDVGSVPLPAPVPHLQDQRGHPPMSRNQPQRSGQRDEVESVNVAQKANSRMRKQNFHKKSFDEVQPSSNDSNIRTVLKRLTRDKRTSNDQQPDVTKRSSENPAQEDKSVSGNGIQNNAQQPRNPTSSQENETGQLSQKPAGYNPYRNFKPNQGKSSPYHNHLVRFCRNHGYSYGRVSNQTNNQQPYRHHHYRSKFPLSYHPTSGQRFHPQQQQQPNVSQKKNKKKKKH